MACTDVQTIQAGNGTKTQFSFDFPYIFKSEIHVYFWNAVTKEYDEKLTTDATYPWQITDANPTIVEFTGTAPPSPATPVDPGETTVDNVKIRRITKIDDIRALFNPGSAIRSDDLNKNFEQLRYAIQEANCAGIPDDVDEYLKDYYWDRYDNTLYDGDTWVSDDTKIATTAALDARFQDEVNDTFTKAELAAASNIMPDDDVAVPTTGALNDYINEVITNDIGTDGTGITVTDDGDGTITLGLADNTIDFSKIKNDDIITYAEQPTVTTSDNNIFTASAAERQFDTIVQVATPSGSDWEVGKTWLQNDDDKTVSIWNGSAWVAVSSGGAFTELTKVIYVDSVNGDDALAGHRISNPKKTIKAAIDDINADADGDGSIVLVAPGIYGETFPISIQKNDVAIVGQSLRNCIVHPAIPAADQAGYDVDVPETNELATMFEVNSGTYIYGLTLQGMKASGTRGGNSLDTDSTYGLPTNQGWNFAFRSGATIKKSPYIQNCTNFSDSQINNVNFTPHTPGEGAAGDLDSGPSGGGILIDGSTPAANSPLRSMVCDSYTHTALNGPGIFVTNNGYCQATSSYSFFNHFHLKTKNGGQANLAASTTDFGSHSLIADGRSPYAIFTATTTATASDGSTTFTIGAPTARTATPLPWHGNATRPQDNMLVDIGGNTYPILSAVAAGSGWTVTISRPDPNDRSSNLGLDGAVSSGASVSFFLRSMIASSGHTMEYVGSGTDYRALPENGGVPDDTKQLTELNNGKIWAAITDHRGTFSVGDTFSVNQQTGFVDIDEAATNSVTKTGVNGNAIIPAGTTAQRGTPSNGHFRYNTSNHEFEGYVNGAWGGISNIVTDLTPQLGGDLDVNGQSIVSTSNGNITLDPDGSGYIILDSNVGVGTSSPARILHASGSGTQAIRIENTAGTGNAILEYKLPSNTFSAGINSTAIYYDDTAGNPYVWYQNGTERMRLNYQGRLGINTSSPSGTLHVNGTGIFDSAITAKTYIQGHNSALTFYGDSTSGSGDAMVLTSSGNLGIGTSSPAVLLDLSNSSNAYIRQTRGSTTFRIGPTGSSATSGAIVATETNGPITFATNGLANERMRLDSSGRLLVGTSSSINFIGGTSAGLQAINTSTQYALGMERATNDTAGPVCVFRKTRSTTNGGNTVVNSGDDLGNIRFAGTDGSSAVSSAEIKAQVDGTPGSNDMPGRLVLATTADGASSPTERMRISSSGLVGIGVTAPAARLDVQDSIRIRKNASNLAKLEFQAASTRIEYSDQSGNLEFYTNSSRRAFVGYTGGFNVVSGGLNLTAGNITFSGADRSIINNDNNALAFGTNATERVRIDNNGRLLVGTSTARATGGSQNRYLQVEGTSYATAGLSLTCNSTSNSSGFNFGRSRGTSVGSTTAVQDGDDLGFISWSAADGTDLVSYAAYIYAQIDGTTGSNNTPGRLIFSTTAPGNAASSERMRIDSSGRVGIGTTSPGQLLTLSSASPRILLTQTSANSNAFVDAATSGVLEFSADDNNVASSSSMRFKVDGTEHFRIADNGDLTATDTTIGSNSDSRLKTNIADFAYDLEAFKQYQPKTFDWKNPELHGNKTGQRGFIAQDVEAVDSYWVGEQIVDEGSQDAQFLDENRVAKTLKLGKKDAMYVSVIQQLLAKVETLETKVAALEAG